MDNNPTDEARAARAQRRTYRKQADLLLVQAELDLARHIATLLKGDTLSTLQSELLGVLIDSLGKLRDQRMAMSWTVKLSSAILSNPRLADSAAGMKSLHKVASAAAKVVKASAPDKREYAERQKLDAARAEHERSLGRRMALPGETPAVQPDNGRDLLRRLREESGLA